MTAEEIALQITLKAMELKLLQEPLYKNFDSPESYNEALADAFNAFYNKIVANYNETTC